MRIEMNYNKRKGNEDKDEGNSKEVAKFTQQQTTKQESHNIGDVSSETLQKVIGKSK